MPTSKTSKPFLLEKDLDQVFLKPCGGNILPRATSFREAASRDSDTESSLQRPEKTEDGLYSEQLSLTLSSYLTICLLIRILNVSNTFNQPSFTECILVKKRKREAASQFDRYFPKIGWAENHL